MSTYFITKANFLRLFSSMSKNYALEYKQYYKYDIDEFSDEKLAQILLISYFLSDPDLLSSQLSSVGRADSYNYMTPPSLPAYHVETTCERMTSDYTNIMLPIGIKGNIERTERCRMIWTAILNAQAAESSPSPSSLGRRTRQQRKVGKPIDQRLERLVLEIKQATYFQNEFKKDGLSINDLETKSFIHLSRNNSGATTLSVEEEIDASYLNYLIEVKRETKAFTDVKKIRLEGHAIFKRKYEDQLFSLIIEFIIARSNPKLEFENDILKALGFTRCYTCCGYEDDDDEYSPTLFDPIEEFRATMNGKFDILVVAGVVVMSNTFDTALENEQQIKDASPNCAFFGLHAVSRRMQGIIKKGESERYYAELAKDKYGEPIEAKRYELCAVKLKDTTQAIKGERKILLLVPLKD